ncbi:MAG: DUF2939 domain-containing protein [Pseudoxanthomonas suwonensis]|nr:DUF2939 domain-containing protein [Pseudoxanthomonas suwonensis]
MTRSVKWLLWCLVLAAVLLLGFVIAGPWIAMRGIQHAVTERSVTALMLHVDFPELRGNVRAQLEDRIARDFARRVGNDTGMLGMAGGALAKQVSDSAVDAMVSPAGIMVLLEGNALARGIAGRPLRDADGARIAPVELGEASTRYESTSRFTATLRSRDGSPVTFVFTRKGLRWKLSDIHLPSPT